MLRRRHSQQGPSIFFDDLAGNEHARSLRLALKAGDTASVAAAYAAADCYGRDLLAWALSDTASMPIVDAWVAREPSSVAALVIRGAQRTMWAWEARGGGRANTVDPGAWDVFHGRLRSAEVDLRRAADLVDDGVAWERMLLSGRGLELTLDELVARYARATKACPRLPFAVDQMLQCTCEKWAGSHEDMFDFARYVAANAPDGHPCLRVIPLAHLERALSIEDPDERRRYRADPAVHAELIDAANRSVFRPGFGDDPQSRTTLSAFALVLGYVRRFDVAGPLLQRVGPWPTDYPWNSFSDPAALLQELRERSGLPPLP
jgi:hypothetical protein